MQIKYFVIFFKYKKGVAHKAFLLVEQTNDYENRYLPETLEGRTVIGKTSG